MKIYISIIIIASLISNISSTYEEKFEPEVA